ncbi:conserved hypothetical protein [Ricinus communis]|uniref:Secreted protein n=1 Tax=Ricinus communis TaxID=3988 RepID=B9SFB8_RICCO|nr:conserved hypothetical protein [Ricinus communis]
MVRSTGAMEFSQLLLVYSLMASKWMDACICKCSGQRIISERRLVGWQWQRGNLFLDPQYLGEVIFEFVLY